MSRYQFIEQAADTEPVQVLCRVLQVSTAGYYQWQRWQRARYLAGSPPPTLPFRAMPSAMAPVACEPSCRPKVTPPAAMPCAVGYAAAACGR